VTVEVGRRDRGWVGAGARGEPGLEAHRIGGGKGRARNRQDEKRARHGDGEEGSLRHLLSLGSTGSFRSGPMLESAREGGMTNVRHLDRGFGPPLSRCALAGPQPSTTRSRVTNSL